MKRFSVLILAICIFVFMLSACGSKSNGETAPSPSEQTTENSTDLQDSSEPNETPDAGNSENKEDEITDTVYLTIGSHRISVKLEKNEATDALTEILNQGDITYTASDYGGFEKVGDLGHMLPHSDRRITTEAGDVILYLGNQIVLFYGSNTWSYTKLGKMNGYSASELRDILTESNPVSVKISLQ